MFYYLFAYLQGARLKTLSAIIVPILMASSWAFYKEGVFDIFLFVMTLLSGGFIQISANLFNDALDFQSGVDTAHRIGPPRLTQTGKVSPRTVLFFGVFSACMSALAGIPLVLRGGVLVFVCGICFLTLAYLYSGSSFSLVKKGLAELCVYVFFGLFIVGLTYYIQTLTWDISLFYLGSQCGLWSLSMLFINYLRDEEEDRRGGRKHCVTTYGRSASLFALGIFQIVIYLFCFYWLNLDIKGGAFSFFLIVPSSVLFYFVCVIPPSKKYNVLLGLLSLLYVLFGLSWIYGLLF